MHQIFSDIDSYATQHSATEPTLLAQLSKETFQKVLNPRMLSGHLQGRVLSMLSKLIKPNHILEIGTYTGYATLCLAEGLTPYGTLDTLDCNEELFAFQQKYFEASGYGLQIEQHLGNALEILPKLTQKKYDLVFLDADKENYINYLYLLIPMINVGGVLLSDNVLWSGKVLEPTSEKDITTKILQEYNQLLANHPQFETVLLPIRDGLTISRKVF